MMDGHVSSYLAAMHVQLLKCYHCHRPSSQPSVRPSKRSIFPLNIVVVPVPGIFSGPLNRRDRSPREN